MNQFLKLVPLALLSACAFVPFATAAQPASPYRILQTAQYPGSGGIDYVVADSDARKLYVPRGTEILVFDLDTLKSAGTIANARARGVAIDPASHHAFSSSSPVVMWDTRTLAPIKTIDIQGRPDGILFEPATQRVFVFSHVAPNATVIDAKEGTVVGTIDLGGAPEQAASDGKGRLYVDLEDKDKVAVVDMKELKVIAQYGFDGKGGAPAGLTIDRENGILFALCRNPQVCVVMNASDGKIVTTLPIGRGSDGGVFNPRTKEIFSSQGDGTLTIIKENSPTSFVLSQTLETKTRAKTCTFDAKTGHVVLITTEPMPGAEPPAPKEKGKKGGANAGPAMLDIMVVGR